ncbi:MAG: hypothetical protein KatS3mg097_218 [Candidatus Parcubacteria bacterium]|nr:MAG: hypothetical protein KatS3mg097_218 [Candidatus Parcubacteria bacterium]
MINYYLIILGYFFILLSIILLYIKIKKTPLAKEDNIYWARLSKQIKEYKAKTLNILKISEEEIIYLIKNLLEKILLRIKIEALKVETWANKNLEKLRNKNSV